MKSLNVNKITAVFFTAATLWILGSSFTQPKMPAFIPSLNSYLGNWQYMSIDRNSKSLTALTPNDQLKLWNPKPGESDMGAVCNFSYDIESMKKHQSGTFTLNYMPTDSSPVHQALFFTYPNLAKPRIFNVAHISEDSLVIREGKLFFRYKRIPEKNRK